MGPWQKFNDPDIGFVCWYIALLLGYAELLETYIIVRFIISSVRILYLSTLLYTGLCAISLLSLEVISAHHLNIIKKYKILHYSPILCNGKMVIIPRVECVTITQWSQPSESVMGWNCLHVIGVVHSRIVDQEQVNTLRPRQNGRHFADDILKCIFLNEKVWIPIEISLKFVSKG